MLQQYQRRRYNQFPITNYFSPRNLANIARVIPRAVASTYRLGKRTFGRAFEPGIVGGAAAAARYLGSGKRRRLNATTKGSMGGARGRVYRRSRKGFRKRKMRIMRRYRRYQRFAKKVRNVNCPSIIYRRQYLVNEYQEYNLKLMDSPFTFWDRTVLGQLATDYFNAVAKTTSATDRLYIRNRFINYNITNYSPTMTYVTIYWLGYKDDCSKTLSDCFANDVTRGYYSAYATTAEGRQQVPITWRLKDSKVTWEIFKLLGKQTFIMEGGGVAHGKQKFRDIKYTLAEQQEAANSPYLKYKTLIPVICAKSQLVKNGDNNSPIIDNARLLIEFMVNCRMTGELHSKFTQPFRTAGTTVVLGTPSAFSDETLQNT